MEQVDIYARHAAEYDELVGAEDRDGNLLPAIEAICPLAGAKVLEVGAGTGRIARLMLPKLARYVGVDRERAMLDVAQRHLSAIATGAAWELCRADARDLGAVSMIASKLGSTSYSDAGATAASRLSSSIASMTASSIAPGWADLAIAGWVFGHFREWMPERWQDEAGQAIAEMRRVLRPGGTIILVETLGTGREEPAPPTPGLAEYFAWLEAQGFTRTAIRTDYQFPSVDEAARITGFFFGEGFAARVRREGWARVPEQTGLWWQRAAS